MIIHEFIIINLFVIFDILHVNFVFIVEHVYSYILPCTDLNKGILSF